MEQEKLELTEIFKLKPHERMVIDEFLSSKFGNYFIAIARDRGITGKVNVILDYAVQGVKEEVQK